MAPTYLDVLTESESRLTGLDSPRLSAELLMAEVLGCSRLTVTLERDRLVVPEDLERIRTLVARRAAGEPVAYILGQKEFYGLDFRVTPDVLIPRPETEHIVESVEAFYGTGDMFRFADLGTGSGILAVTIASLFPNATGIAVDLSCKALTVAQGNAASHGVIDRVEFMEGDFTQSLFPNQSLDLIVSNPPYVTEQEYADASHEVTTYEPRAALVSGADGLDHVRAMLPRVEKALKPGGRFLMEIGWQQGEKIKKITSRDFPEFSTVRIITDLAGHDRVVFMQK